MADCQYRPELSAEGITKSDSLCSTTGERRSDSVHPIPSTLLTEILVDSEPYQQSSRKDVKRTNLKIGEELNWADLIVSTNCPL